MGPFLKAIKVIPASYLYYYWTRRDSIEKQREDMESGKGTRADRVMKIEQRLFEMYGDKSVDEMPAELKKRGGAFYSDVALNCISVSYTHLDVYKRQARG